MVAADAPVPNRGPTFITITSILLALAVAITSYRLLFSLFMKKALSSDDLLIAASMGTQIVSTVVSDMATYYGFGRHKADIARSGGNLTSALKYFWLFQVLYKLALCFTKLSFLAFYLRIFPTKKFRYICYFTMGVIAFGVFSFVMATIFQCVPVAGSWEKSLPSKCIDNSWFRWWWAGFNTATDLWVFLLPMPLLARLQLDLARKIGVMIMFALGLFTCITSILRMHALVESVATVDPTWGSFDALLWSVIEADCGIICACLPFLKPLVKRLFPRLFSSLNSRSARKTSGYKLSGFGRSGPRSQDASQWTNLDQQKSVTGSEEAIAPGQILMKTDISLQTDYRDSRSLEEPHAL